MFSESKCRKDCRSTYLVTRGTGRGKNLIHIRGNRLGGERRDKLDLQGLQKKSDTAWNVTEVSAHHLKEVRNVEQLKVIQIRKRKQTKEPVRQPDTYDKIVERAFWFVIGFSIALLVCCVAFGQTINA